MGFSNLKIEITGLHRDLKILQHEIRLKKTGRSFYSYSFPNTFITFTLYLLIGRYNSSVIWIWKTKLLNFLNLMGFNYCDLWIHLIVGHFLVNQNTKTCHLTFLYFILVIFLFAIHLNCHFRNWCLTSCITVFV